MVTMMKRFILALIFLSGFIHLSAQSPRKALRYYNFGMSAYRGCSDTCETNIAQEYGLINIQKAGCVVRPGQVRRWNRHNKKVDSKLAKRHGEGWRDKYYAGLADCCRKK
ncbi:MAG: hypothetical protein K0S33_86 [Bacteroidetes bacterium]|jgi:hypothetical protein|nr:hypothetical protein [Bacteroidota bacterium]